MIWPDMEMCFSGGLFPCDATGVQTLAKHISWLGLRVPCLSSLNILEYMGLIVSAKNSLRRHHGTERSRLRVSMKKLPLLRLCPSQPLVGQGLCECLASGRAGCFALQVWYVSETAV